MSRRFPLEPPGRVDVESLWGTQVGDDVDLDDGPATSFRVPPPPTYLVQDALEKIAATVSAKCDQIIIRLDWFQWMLSRCLWMMLLGAGTTALILLIKWLLS